LTVYGDGHHTRSFGYCDDTIAGVLALSESTFQEPINIGSQFEYSVLEFAKLIIELTGSKSKIDFLPPLPDDPRQRRPDLTRAKEILNWEPTTPLIKGLTQTIDYFKGKMA